MIISLKRFWKQYIDTVFTFTFLFQGRELRIVEEAKGRQINQHDILELASKDIKKYVRVKQTLEKMKETQETKKRSAEERKQILDL